MTNGQEPLRVPEPQLQRKRRGAASRVFLSLFLIGLFAVIAAGAVAFYGYGQYSLPGPLAQKKVFEIEKGLGTEEIGAKLEDAGIIANGRIFSAAAYLTGARGRLKAGEYEFAARASIREVIGLLESGKSIVYKISIPEGWTSDMVLARVNENQVLTGDVTQPPAEGAVMPDTYVFKRGMTRQKLIDDMEAAQVKLLDDIWAGRRMSIAVKTEEEAVVLASIVEKETGQSDERPLIASVFMNRLHKGMRLQSDPTIIYGITGGKGKLDRSLTKTDIVTPTPYNTYTIDGLPPGPIANPGRAALEAVVNPADTNYLFFVADGTGGHAFASTLEEHNRNVAKWRDLAGNAASATAAETAAMEKAAETAASEKAAETAAAENAAPPVTEPVAGSNTLPAIEPEQAQTVPALKPEAGAAVAVDEPAAAPPAAETPEQPAAEVPANDAVTPPAKVTPPVTVATLDLKPGSVIKSGTRLIPVPKRKPKH